jgi:uncharacterized phage protein gp47/JayE
MPFSRPTLSALLDQTRADVAVALGLSALLRSAPERALADAEAGLTQGLYDYLDWIAKQSNPFTCTDEYLEAWAALAPTPVLRLPATSASGSATFTGTNGTVLPTGTAVLRSDGVAFVTTAGGTVSAGTVTVPIAASDTGATTNTADSAALTLASPIAGINAVGAAAGALVGGADIETDDALRPACWRLMRPRRRAAQRLIM